MSHRCPCHATSEPENDLMSTRPESAARTRRALIDAAAELLDAAGPDAVTLRAVGSAAGVSRGAPYRHFADKEGLLMAVSVESWNRLADDFGSARRQEQPPHVRLRRALTAIVELARTHPHLYQLMFVIPRNDPSTGAAAAARAVEEFMAIVGGVVGEQESEHYGALLFCSAHGIAGLEITGHLGKGKWGTNPDRLIESLASLAAVAPRLERDGQPDAGRQSSTTRK